MTYEPGERYIWADGVFVKQQSRSNRGLCIEGVATKYNVMLQAVSGRFVNLQPGCFSVSLQYDSPEVWLDHDSTLALKDCRVELYDGEEALNFRVHLNDSEICNQTRALVESGIYNQVSLGWNSSVVSKRVFDATEVSFVLAGSLTDVSLLPAAACATTHVQISELKNCRSLRDDVESKKFAVDNSWAELQRKLTALESDFA